jgi:uncharacterized cupin superfamily protein
VCPTVATPEARIERTDEGEVVASPGWFVLNVGDVAWQRHDIGGEWTSFEPGNGGFEQYGIGIHVLQPGQPNGKYHSETNQEDFLVLSGECLLIVEDEERPLKQWDFFHCAPGTHHILVGAGDAPCAILMVGARGNNTLHYPPSEVAARYGAAAPEETNTPSEAYKDWPGEFRPVRATWPVSGTVRTRP